MTVLSAAFEAARKAGDIVEYPVGANTTIYKGQMVVTRGDGYAYPLRAPAADQPDTFLGFAEETVQNVAGDQPPFSPVVAGAAGALPIHVRKTGTFIVSKSSAALTDISMAMYGADANTVSATSTNAVLVGYVTEIINSGQLRIDIRLASM